MRGIIKCESIPGTCQHIKGNPEYGCQFGGIICGINNLDVIQYAKDGTKPAWCPIRPIEEYSVVTDIKTSLFAPGKYVTVNGFYDGEDLSPGKQYKILGSAATMIHIINDFGKSGWYSCDYFYIIDHLDDKQWHLIDTCSECFGSANGDCQTCSR